MSRMPPDIAKAARDLHTSGQTPPVYLCSREHPGWWWRWQQGPRADRGQFVGDAFVCDPPVCELEDWQGARA